MDDVLERYAAALRAALREDQESEAGEWVEPAEPGADVAAWSAAPEGDELAGGGAAFETQLDADARETLLELARVVAHGSERRNAPLATFLAGRFVAVRVARGADMHSAAMEALTLAQDTVESSA